MALLLKREAELTANLHSQERRNLRRMRLGLSNGITHTVSCYDFPHGLPDTYIHRRQEQQEQQQQPESHSTMGEVVSGFFQWFGTPGDTAQGNRFQHQQQHDSQQQLCKVVEK